ncbi:hypothetical protein Asp14428_34430 [Actinoplanes sp. NBRC 14428]|uniref:Uncharacterized protein n=1 Tax=Pseudosporangium ferrugineum TaxID=439699 RepID=A0A2T0RF34_9ACTN|nr:hypothetical protein [Pseudosporangium ferrugineum]PRY19749.1 hypothetical protein CLV70_12945 [Pseudosporangium ferrugineum]BCJ51968.1 hypothetical protein Asp14428_34430 [Actinoplanes sp. NBRC 14428]
MKTRGIAGALLAAGLLVAGAGCDPAWAEAQFIEVVAGGGENDGGAAADAFIDGRLVDMVAGRDGVLRVLTEQKDVLTLWAVRDGQLGKVTVPDLKADYISQVAAGPGDTVYAAMWNGDGGVWQIKADGSVAQKVGIDRDTYRGDRKPAADGAAVAGAYVRYLHGVAVTADDRLYFAEERIEPVTHQLVRTVQDGKLKTVLGRDLTGLTERQWRSARTTTGFPAETPGPQIAVENGLNDPLALGPDGTLYAAPGRRSVVAVRPNGLAHEVIGNTGGGYDEDAEPPEEPFLDRGPAKKARVNLTGTGSARLGQSNASLVTDADGDLYLTSVHSESDFLPDSFAWTGDVTDTQRELLERSKKQRRGDTEILRVRKDGSLSTVAGHADAVAVQGEWIYLARAFTDVDNNPRVIVVRTEVVG